MRKKILGLLLIGCMVFGLAACGGADGEKKDETNKEESGDDEAGGNGGAGSGIVDDLLNVDKTSEIATFTIEGNEYDLSGDFQEVVGQMVKDGITVKDHNGTIRVGVGEEPKRRYFTEDGKTIIDKIRESETMCTAAETPNGSRYSGLFYERTKELGTFIRKYYRFELADIDVEIPTIEELKTLNEYRKTSWRVSTHVNKETYAALYISGEAVNLSDYEDKYEQWVAAFEGAEADKAAVANEATGLTEKTYYQEVSTLWMMGIFGGTNSVEEVEEYCSQYRIPFKEDMLMSFALQDAGNRLENGEIDSFVLVGYGDMEEDGIAMEYREFYFDKNWDQGKFKSDN